MMAQRKDMMRIIRQDAGFSAKLGFGGTATAPTADAPAMVRATVTGAETAIAMAASDMVGTVRPSQSCNERPDDGRRAEVHANAQKVEVLPRAAEPASATLDRVATISTARGHVVYVAVSLTARQAVLAEAWATVARCSVQFLIRRVAQGSREQVFEDWERDGMPQVIEPRGARGKHPTSVTLTLLPQFAAALSTKHDPLGMLGLARVMGPAFRERFQDAFDVALAKAKIQMVNEGIET
jgi:hypothetical protein